MVSASREELHRLLKVICPNVYFQPPSNVMLKYPCIVYRKSGSSSLRANNRNYVTTPEYAMTVIDRDPDSQLPQHILGSFAMCEDGTVYVVDGIYHTPITLHY